MVPEQAAQKNSGDAPIRSASESERDPLEKALAEFTEAKRRGQCPTIEDYVQRFPALSAQIRELFPLIDDLERWKNDKEIECLKRSVPREFSFDQLGDYKLVRELGRGGMGVVFQAIHQTSQRSVAIKLLPWRYAADMPVWKERLQREAATIAALQHPGIVPIYSFSEDQGYYYYAMQLVDGEGLDKIIQRLKQSGGNHRRSFDEVPGQPFVQTLAYDSWRGFAKIGEQVALALWHAHRQGVAHNDIKPSNLLVRSNGQVIVTDFGIGRPQCDEPSAADDHAIGTLRYMAPERWQGNLGPPGDIYALGATLYELSTQRPVFSPQNRAELIDSILHHEPTNPRRIVPDLPAPFERIILKAMAKSPANRYPTAHALAADLRRFINRRPVHATEQNLIRRLSVWLTAIARSWRKSAK